MPDEIPFNHHKLKYFSLAIVTNVFSISCFLFNLFRISYSVVGGVGVAPWGLENGNFLGFILNWWLGQLDESLGGWPGVGGSCLWGSLGNITGGLVWSSGGWVGVVVWDSVWLLSGAWGSGWAVHWAVGSGADLFSAVNTIWAVVSVAGWKWSSALNDDWGPLSEGSGVLLIVVEWLALHDDVLTKVLITVHTGGEELGVWWRAGNSSNTGVNACRDHKETTSRWHSLGPGWLVEVWWGIVESSGRGGCGEEGENSSFHYFNYYPM